MKTFCRFGRGREELPQVREDLPRSREGSGGPLAYPGGVGQTSRRSRRGREYLPLV